jgi:hypothetical protein
MGVGGAWPWNLLLQRVPIAKLIGGMLFVWGAVCMLQAAVFNFSGFFAVRFFLGMLEGCISPAWVVSTTSILALHFDFFFFFFFHAHSRRLRSWPVLFQFDRNMRSYRAMPSNSWKSFAC